MNDLAELKQYVAVHARGQRIPHYQTLLDRIETDEGTGPGSWVGEWSRVATTLERAGRDLEAARCFALARFPYVDGPPRQEALERCVGALDRWRRSTGGDIEPLDVELGAGRVRCWTSGLSRKDPKPLLIVMGGIVTVKEQWAPVLAGIARLGMAGLVTEMPSTGENTLPYGPDSWRMLSGLLDAVADRADTARTYAIALSFSGHMALRAAVDDSRLRGVVTVGAPVSEFFTDTVWQKQVPRITVDTLAHMTGRSPDGMVGGLGEWALSEAELGALDIPVSYAACLRDEIIPHGEVDLLRSRVRELDLVLHDDVHGAPGHVDEIQLWTVAAVLRARGVRNLQSALINLLRYGRRARRRFTQHRETA